MRRFLIDTPILGAGLFRRPAALQLLRPFIANQEAATSIVTYGELIEHVRSRPNFDQHRNDLRDLLGEVTPYFLTYNIMERYADIRRQLRPPHGPGLIGDIDTLIAATALERNLTVVTTDSDFERVPGLKVMIIPRRTLETR